MKLGARPLLACALVAGALACGVRQPATAPESAETAAPTPPVDEGTRQEMAALAFISYLGELVRGSDDEVEKELTTCLEHELQKQPLTKGKWQLAWGPAVYEFRDARFNDNLMYVVRDDGDPAHLAIVIRGTNAPAILDWLREDLEVFKEVPWGYGTPPPGAAISKATANGFDVLRAMSSAHGPAPNQTLSAFLAEQARSYPALRLDFTGHSLGGALAPALALWLVDTQAQWSPSQPARVAVYTFAGPTSGNAAFAAYAADRLAVTRTHNKLDIVPLVWNYETMASIGSLYEPHARAPVLVRDLVAGLRDLVKHKQYTQLTPGDPLASAFQHAEADFLKQVGWQHSCGYRCALGLFGETFKPVRKDCTTDSPEPCACGQP